MSLFDAGGIAETRRLRYRGRRAPKREVVGTGDLDGDGRADVLVRFIGATALGLWRMNGAAVISRTRLANLRSELELGGRRRREPEHPALASLARAPGSLPFTRLTPSRAVEGRAAPAMLA